MLKVTSSYCVKVVGEEKIFRETIAVYREALAFLIEVIDTEWDLGLAERFKESAKKAKSAVEALVHTTRQNHAKYEAFDEQFYKCPSYLRRAAPPTGPT